MSSQGAGARREHAAEEVAAALERVFERPQLQPEGPDPFERAIERLFEALGSLDVDPAAGWALLWFSAVVGIVLVTWWLIARHPGPRRRKASEDPASGAGAQAVDLAARLSELDARAQAARAAGDWALALRLSFFALLVALSRRGDLELRAAWTHREMFERGRPSERARAALEPWLSELDAKLFGAGGVGPADLAWFDGLRERLLAQDGGGAP